MAKAARKNTTAAKRAAPDPIIQTIKAADQALEDYREAENILKAARANVESATEALERITKAMAKAQPTARLLWSNAHRVAPGTI